MDRPRQLMIARLTAGYRQGRLVPFLGAGMSVPACPGWQGFVEGLEREVFGSASDAPDTTDSEALIRRANQAVRQIRLQGKPKLAEAVLRSLQSRAKPDTEVETPVQTAALARLFWPLVLTSNYDDLFFKAWNNQHQAVGSSMQVLGRSSADCRDVLASLHSSRPPILWALQGYVGQSVGPRVRQLRRTMAIDLSKTRKLSLLGVGNVPNLSTSAPTVKEAIERKLEQLRGQLVVGHEEYRRVAFTEPQFRRVFAEVFRARSLLFVGCSMSDQYLLNLFGETLEIFGTNPHPHYALVLRGSTDPEFLRSRLNTFVYEYEEHSELPGLLTDLHDAVENQSARVRTWSYALTQTVRTVGPRKATDLQIVRGDLPAPLPGECVALGVTVASDGTVRMSRGESDVVRLLECEEATRKLSWSDKALVKRVADQPLFLFRMATDTGHQDVREYARAIAALLQSVDTNEFSMIRTRLPLPDRHQPENLFDRLRKLIGGFMGGLFEKDFLQRYWLMEIIRAFGVWRRTADSSKRLELAVHLLDQGILFDMATGRIDPIELLMCDDLRFTVEVADETNTLLSELYQCEGTVTLAALAARLRILQKSGAAQSPERWLVEVDPSPTGWPSIARLSDAGVPEKSIAELGVLTDSVLRFVRVAPPETSVKPPAAPPKSKARTAARTRRKTRAKKAK